jgi:hyperosmotically inducible periplasmic protein
MELIMPKKFSRIFLSLLIALYTTLLFSCYTPAGRSAGAVVDDASITAQIKATLLTEQIMNGIAISISTFKGEVTLTGAVTTAEQIKKATEIATSTRGVRKVENLIKLK